MTELAVRPEQTAIANYSSDNMDRLARWAEQARIVSTIAADICSTSFAPQAYRGKPAEATAAILAGAELGLDPMASLRAFDSIQGVPAPKAMTLRAVVLAAGHDIEIVESSAERAVVRGRRRGKTDWQTSVWDTARASLMPQYKSNPNYKTNPAAMLVARATAEVCRWVASDAVMGMPYAAEEVGDFEQLPAAPTARRLTVAELDASPDRERRAAADLAAIAPTDDHGMVTDQQRNHMFALWGELGMADDAHRERRLKITARILGLPELDSSNELTYDEAEKVIAALVERKAKQDAMPV